jgi:hypothetical protein
MKEKRPTWKSDQLCRRERERERKARTGKEEAARDGSKSVGTSKERERLGDTRATKRKGSC